MQLKNAISGLLLGLSILGGCGSSHQATTQPSTQPYRPIATDIDPALANPDYWYAQPGVASVPANDYDKLWYACERAIRGRRFAPDRMDYRDGVMTSEPLVSKQFWELWRSDVVDAYDLEESSIATHRRTIRFDVKRGPGGSCTAVPKVVIERFTAPDRRITVANNYRSAVSPMERIASQGPQSINLPGVHRWYALRRDAALEKALAQDVQGYLAQ